MTPGIARWHALMHSTAYLLLICGIPGTMLASLLMFLKQRFSATLALRFCVVMIAAELVIAVPLLLIAKWLARRGDTAPPTRDSPARTGG